MGNCTLHPKRSSELKHPLPEFYYLCRSTRTLLHSHNRMIESLTFNDKFALYSDTIIGHLGLEHIASIGGTKPNGKTSRKAFIINTKLQSFQSLPKFPTALESGFIFYYDHSIFALNSRKLELYRLTVDCWKFCDLDYNHAYHRRLKGFSAYMQYNYIFLVFGYMKSEPNLRVFYINLQDFSMDATTERMTKFLQTPVCYANKNSVVIGGGLTEAGAVNDQIYVKDSSKPWSDFTLPSLGKLENYPILFKDNVMLCFAYPKLLARFGKTFVVYNLSQPDEGYVPTHESNKQSLVSLKSMVSEKSEYIMDAQILKGEILENPYTSSSSDSDFFQSQELPAGETPGAMRQSLMSRGRDLAKIQIQRFHFSAPLLPSNVKESK